MADLNKNNCPVNSLGCTLAIAIGLLAACGRRRRRRPPDRHPGPDDQHDAVDRPDQHPDRQRHQPGHHYLRGQQQQQPRRKQRHRHRPRPRHRHDHTAPRRHDLAPRRHHGRRRLHLLEHRRRHRHQVRPPAGDHRHHRRPAGPPGLVPSLGDPWRRRRLPGVHRPRLRPVPRQEHRHRHDQRAGAAV